jgi:alkaline phosphatase D
MAFSRREFLAASAAAGAAALVRLDAAQPSGASCFRHGVASGDPLTDCAMLWTRVTAPMVATTAMTATPEVRWEVATDTAFRRIVTRGTLTTGAERDFTVKVDAGGLRPATTYYYRFQALGERSAIGRTRTLPVGKAERVRLGLASCSNFPYGLFNVYRRMAARNDLDAACSTWRLHLSICNGGYGDGASLARFRILIGKLCPSATIGSGTPQHKSDPNLQVRPQTAPVHRGLGRSYEIANNAWRDGAQNHNPTAAKRSGQTGAAVGVLRMDAHSRGSRHSAAAIYRSFAFGDLGGSRRCSTPGSWTATSRLASRGGRGRRRSDALAPRTHPGAMAASKSRRLEACRRVVAGLASRVMFGQTSRPGATAGSTDT